MLRAAIAGAASAVVLASAPVCARAQTANDFYFDGNLMVGVVIHLDSMGIFPRPSADSAAVVDSLAPYGLTLARTTRDGLYVFRLAQPVSRAELFELAMTIETADSTVVGYAGPFMHMAASDFFLVATSQLIVQYSPGTTVSTIDSVNAEFGALVAGKTPFKPNHFLLQLTQQSSGDVLQITQQYHQLPMVDYAYPNFLSGVSAGFVPDDPFFAEQWHLQNDGGNGGTPGADIQAVDAWDIEVGDPDIVIAVIEIPGFEVDHPDLKPNLWDNLGELGLRELGGNEDGNKFVGDVHGWNFDGTLCPTKPVYSVADPGLDDACGSGDLSSSFLEHGTAVAGLAAARGNNGIGVTGVCQKCSLMLIRAGPTEYGQYLAFLYAATEGADVINASIIQAYERPALRMAIEEAAGAHDIPIVFSVGYGRGYDYNECSGPLKKITAMPEVIAVSWSDNKDERVSLSGYGDCIDLVAPGALVGRSAGITTTDSTGCLGFNHLEPIGSGCPNGVPELGDLAYTSCFRGTSASAPIVSGTIGLMLSKDPDLTRQEITTILHETAEKVGSLSYTSGFNQYYGYGRVNAFCALGGTGPPCPEQGDAGEAEPATAATTECSDGIDNDADGLIDYPDDDLCYSYSDNSEAMICHTICGRTFCLNPVYEKLVYLFVVAMIVLLSWKFWWSRRKRA